MIYEMFGGMQNGNGIWEMIVSVKTQNNYGGEKVKNDDGNGKCTTKIE